MPDVNLAREQFLTSLLDRYFRDIQTGRPLTVPVTPDVVFTENGQRLALGKGLAATATPMDLPPARAVTVVDVEQRQAVGWGLVAEAGEEAVLGVRVRERDGRAAEIETVVVRPHGLDGRGGLLVPGAFELERPEFAPLTAGAAPVGPAELRHAADRYLDGISGAGADIIPVTDDCRRIENGLQTVLNPSGEGLPDGFPRSQAMAYSVTEQVRKGFIDHIDATRDRRCYLVDTRRALVFVAFIFDHPGKVRDSERRAPFPEPNSMWAWEVWRVTGGTIRHIEALVGTCPYKMRSPWPTER